MVSEAQPYRTQRRTSAEEEALKRNTDCVYYLASPLTCKKGDECEFRHSEMARVNPQDCWFWVNGNCLNPKCAFRHPSLDGLVDTQTETSSGYSVSQTRTATKTTPYVPNASGKQAVPCVFFQNGYCLKGDWCPFLHAPSSMSNKVIRVPASASVSEPTAVKKAIAMIEKSVQAKKPPTLPAKPVKQVLERKPIYEGETGGPRNDFFIDRSLQHGSGTNEFPGFTDIAPSGNLVSWSGRRQQSHLWDEPESMNVKEVEEVSREHSPGFDVLVDDDVTRESDYYPSEDRYGMSGEHGRNEYDLGGSDDYVDINDDRYQDPNGCDSRGHHQDQYTCEQHRASSERMSMGSYLERRGYAANNSHVQVHESDLRHRLSKHKKPNGLRSVIRRENMPFMHVQDRLGPHGDRQYLSKHDNAQLTSRLRGRIRFPGRSSSPSNGDITMGRMGIVQDKREGRFEDSYSNGWQNNRGLNLRRHDVGDDNEAGFAASTTQKPLGKRKFSSVIEGRQQSPDSLNFDGPKSLDEILKRKRAEASGAKTIKSSVVSRSKEVSDRLRSSQENEDAPQSLTNTTEEGKQNIDETADFDAEANGEKDVGYDYEQTGEEIYGSYDGENGDGDGVEEYVDDDDDFAKKMGLIHNTVGIKDS